MYLQFLPPYFLRLRPSGCVQHRVIHLLDFFTIRDVHVRDRLLFFFALHLKTLNNIIIELDFFFSYPQ